MTVHWIYRAWGVIAPFELCQDASSCIHIHHCSLELQLFQPSWLSPQYASKFSHPLSDTQFLYSKTERVVVSQKPILFLFKNLIFIVVWSGYCSSVRRIPPWYIVKFIRTLIRFPSNTFFFRMLIFFSVFKLLFRHCEFSWNSGCNSKHNRNGLLCAMAWLLSSVPYRHGRTLFCFNHFLEPLRDRRTSILGRKLSSLSEYSLGVSKKKKN